MVEGKDRKIGMGREIKMVRNLELQQVLVGIVQVFNETVAKSMLGLANVNSILRWFSASLLGCAYSQKQLRSAKQWNIKGTQSQSILFGYGLPTGNQTDLG